MRRLCALALVIATIPAAAAFVPLLSGGVDRCEMACHKGATASGASCCLLGGDGGATLVSCPGSASGVPPAPVCRMFLPSPAATIAKPPAIAPLEASERAVRIRRPFEPPDPVPLALS